MTWRTAVKRTGYKAVKSAAYYTPLQKLFVHRYTYMFSPERLFFLCQRLTDTKGMPGPVLEIGCAYGQTTVFLNRHMDCLEDSRQYICIDTFGGFTTEDVQYEATHRGKPMRRYTTFTDNGLKWFKQTMRTNGISRVTAIQADVNQLDFAGIDDISFCLIDVDLYRPVMSALEKVYERAASGAIIVVDDCRQNNVFDGAYEAYMEFVASKGLEPDLVLDKFGVIKMP